MIPRATLILTSLAVLVLAAVAPCQRGVAKITKTKRSHFDAKVSPDGKFVAFRSTNKLGVVDIGGQKEIDVVSSNNIGEFLWTPTSTGVYYLDGAELRFVARTGGKSVLIQKIAGTAPHIWSVNSKDTVLFGTRRDTQAKNNFVFSVTTDGKNQPVDIVKSLLTMDEAMVDPTDKRIAYRRYSPQPFQPVDVRMVDVDGKNDKSLTGKGLSSRPLDLSWLDASGSAVGFTEIDQTTFTWQISKVTTSSSTVVPMTAAPKLHRGLNVSGDFAWLVMDASNQSQTWATSVMPASGGGRVMLEPEQAFALQGRPTMDDNNTVVVFAAKAASSSTDTQVYVVRLDREVRVYPRAEINKVVTVEFPLANGEAGILYASFALLKTPFKLGGFVYGVAIDPTFMLPILQGTGKGTPLKTLIKIPNIAALKGFEVYLQGVRSPNGTSGDLTRYVEVQIF